MHNVGDRMPMRDRRFPGSRTVPFNTNNRFRTIDPSPYHVSGCHLSPPQHMDQGWGERRIASDSALHDSVLRAEVKPKEKTLPSYEVRKVRSPQSRPKSCEVPGMMYPSAEHMSQTGPNLPIAAANTGGSLPDLTNLHIPSPLQTPIDTDEQVNQVLSPTQPFPVSQTRQSPVRRQQVNQQQLRKPQYTNQVPLMDANLTPLENRLQQFQLYPNNDFSSHGSSPITTSASPTLSPTSSSPVTPLFGNLPTSPLSSFNPELYFKQQQQQQQSQQASTLALQQQLEQFSVHRPMPVGGMLNSSMQLPFQTLLAQTPTTMPGQGMPSLAHFYGPGHSRVPDLIVTGIDDDGARSDFAKDLSSAIIGGDDTGEMYSSDDPFQKVVLDPLDVEGFQMLSGQDSELTDAATEDQFRLDRLGSARLH